MSPAVSIALVTVVASLLIMGGEAILSSFNERQLRARGAIEPEGDVIDVMRRSPITDAPATIRATFTISADVGPRSAS